MRLFLIVQMKSVSSFTRRRHPRCWDQMGSSSSIHKRMTQRRSSGKFCTVCEYEGLSRIQTVAAMCEQEINQDRSRPEYQKLKTMVRRTQRWSDQNTKFQSQIRKNWKTQKRERMSALRGQQENAINGRQKDSVQKEMQFPPRRQWGRKESTVVLSCPEVADTKWRKKTPSEAAVLQEGSIKKRADITLLGNCTNPSCDYWHAPVCQGNKTASGCNFGEKCVLRHTEVDSQHSEKPKKSGGKGSVASSLKNSKESGCVLQDVEPPKSKSILRESPKFLGSKRSVQFSKGTPRHVTSRERKGPSQGVIEKCQPHERSPYAPQFEDRTQEETLQQERCARWQSQGNGETCP